MLWSTLPGGVAAPLPERMVSSLLVAPLPEEDEHAATVVRSAALTAIDTTALMDVFIDVSDVRVARNSAFRNG
jgi:hypothetical protein